ncbi:MAG: 50S ribosomal protein L3 [Puniceicoccales bacterium]|jgi:large subunit ribosomal protein L3|nr:50S ribosomal protein L3 [Puniceicoccales bacterium]
MKDRRIVLGKKIGMTQIFDEQKRLIPVTIVEALPCFVAQLKEERRDGYNAIQLAYGTRKEGNLTNPLKGHLKAANLQACAGLKEFPVEDFGACKLGDAIDFSIFRTGEYIDVIGKTKGHGFQGVMKRHGFSGGPASHGSMFHRRGGSYGCRQWPGHVYKGRKMPGHDGCAMRTIQNLKIIELILEKNLLLLKGSLPGNNGGLILLRKAKKMKQGAQ